MNDLIWIDGRGWSSTARPGVSRQRAETSRFGDHKWLFVARRRGKITIEITGRFVRSNKHAKQLCEKLLRVLEFIDMEPEILEG